MSGTISTVLGEVAFADLGVVDYHQHLYAKTPDWLAGIDPDFGLTDEERSAQELAQWAAAGGRTLIEMTTPDFGQDAAALRRIAERVPDVHVLVTTGFNRPFYMGNWLRWLDEPDTIRRVVRDLEEGIGATGVRAAVIKAGTEYQVIDDDARKLLRIAAKAHLETGAPIITHTSVGTMGSEQVAYLTDLGVDPDRICLSHMDRNPDTALHTELASGGVYLGYDCSGKVKYGPDSIRFDLVKHVIEAGQADRILLGGDLGRPSYFVSYGGGPGLDFVLTKFVPRLLKAGAPKETVDGILRDNPRAFLSGATAREGQP